MQFGFSGIKLETICTEKVRPIPVSLVPNLRKHPFLGNIFHPKLFFLFSGPVLVLYLAALLLLSGALNHFPSTTETDVPDLAEACNKLYQFIKQ